MYLLSCYQMCFSVSLAKRSRYRNSGGGGRGFDRGSSFGGATSHKYVGGHDLRAGQKRSYSGSQSGPPTKQAYGSSRPPPPPPSRPPQKSQQYQSSQSSYGSYNQSQSNGSWSSQSSQQNYGSWNQGDKGQQHQNSQYSYGY